MVLCRITRLSIPVQFYWLTTHTHLYSLGYFVTYGAGSFCCQLQARIHTSKLKIREENLVVCTHKSHYFFFFFSLYKKETSPCKHVLQTLVSHYGNLLVECRHKLTPTFYSDPVVFECTLQSLRCLLCGWRQTIINWKHPSGTRTD